MDIYDQILENLELERELGTRTVEIDRALLLPPKPQAETPTPQPEPRTPQPEPHISQPETRNQKPEQTIPPPVVPAAPDTSEGCDIAFLTGRPLSPAGAEAMAKTFAAMKRIKPDLRIALNESRKARVTILLGSEAAKKHLPPSMRPVRGLWLTHDGTQTLMTFSPDYIFSHFQAGSPHERQAKVEMWEDIKSALARLHV